jgi:hypothetical protein
MRPVPALDARAKARAAMLRAAMAGMAARRGRAGGRILARLASALLRVRRDLAHLSRGPTSFPPAVHIPPLRGITQAGLGLAGGGGGSSGALG